MAIELEIVSNSRKAQSDLDRLRESALGIKRALLGTSTVDIKVNKKELDKVEKQLKSTNKKETVTVKVQTEGVEHTRQQLQSLKKEKLDVKVDTKGVAKAQDDIKGLSDSLRSMASSLIISAGAFAVVSKAINLSDSLTNLNARLNVVSDNSAQAAAGLRAIRNIAVESRQPIKDVADLYTRMAMSSKSLGASSKDLAVVTKNITKTMAASGATGQAASAAIIQLGQALSSGVLQGDELRSIAENAPALLTSIAKGMDVSRESIKALGAAGKLTAKQVFDALKKASADADSQFSKIGVTFGQAFTNIGNAVFLLSKAFLDIGGASNGTGIADWLNRQAIGVSRFAERLQYILLSLKIDLLVFVAKTHKAFMSVPESIGRAFTAVKEKFTNFFNGSKFEIRSKELFPDLNTTKNPVKAWIDTAQSEIKRFTDYLMNALGPLVNFQLFDTQRIYNTFEQIWLSLQDKLKSTLEKVKDFFVAPEAKQPNYQASSNLSVNKMPFVATFSLVYAAGVMIKTSIDKLTAMFNSYLVDKPFEGLTKVLQGTTANRDTTWGRFVGFMEKLTYTQAPKSGSIDALDWKGFDPIAWKKQAGLINNIEQDIKAKASKLGVDTKFGVDVNQSQYFRYINPFTGSSNGSLYLPDIKDEKNKDAAASVLYHELGHAVDYFKRGYRTTTNGNDIQQTELNKKLFKNIDILADESAATRYAFENKPSGMTKDFEKTLALAQRSYLNAVGMFAITPAMKYSTAQLSVNIADNANIDKVSPTEYNPVELTFDKGTLVELKRFNDAAVAPPFASLSLGSETMGLLPETKSPLKTFRDYVDQFFKDMDTLFNFNNAYLGFKKLVDTVDYGSNVFKDFLNRTFKTKFSVTDVKQPSDFEFKDLAFPTVLLSAITGIAATLSTLTGILGFIPGLGSLVKMFTTPIKVIVTSITTAVSNLITGTLGAVLRNPFKVGFAGVIGALALNNKDLKKAISGTTDGSTYMDDIKAWLSRTDLGHTMKQILGVKDTVKYQYKNPNSPTGYSDSSPDGYVGRGPNRYQEQRFPFHDVVNAIPVDKQIPLIVGATTIAMGLVFNKFGFGTLGSTLAALVTTFGMLTTARIVSDAEIQRFLAATTKGLLSMISKGITGLFGSVPNMIKDIPGTLLMIGKLALLFSAGRAFVGDMAKKLAFLPTALGNRYADSQNLAMYTRAIQNNNEAANRLTANAAAMLNNAHRSLQQAQLAYANNPNTYNRRGVSIATAAYDNAQRRAAADGVKFAALRNRNDSLTNERDALQKKLNDSSVAAKQGIVNTSATIGGVFGALAGYQIGAKIAEGMVGASDWAKVGVMIGTSMLGQAVISAATASFSAMVIAAFSSPVVLIGGAIVAAGYTIYKLFTDPAFRQVFADIWKGFQTWALSSENPFNDFGKSLGSLMYTAVEKFDAVIKSFSEWWQSKFGKPEPVAPKIEAPKGYKDPLGNKGDARNVSDSNNITNQSQMYSLDRLSQYREDIDAFIANANKDARMINSLANEKVWPGERKQRAIDIESGKEAYKVASVKGNKLLDLVTTLDEATKQIDVLTKAIKAPNATKSMQAEWQSQLDNYTDVANTTTASIEKLLYGKVAAIKANPELAKPKLDAKSGLLPLVSKSGINATELITKITPEFANQFIDMIKMQESSGDYTKEGPDLGNGRGKPYGLTQITPILIKDLKEHGYEPDLSTEKGQREATLKALELNMQYLKNEGKPVNLKTLLATWHGGTTKVRKDGSLVNAKDLNGMSVDKYVEKALSAVVPTAETSTNKPEEASLFTRLSENLKEGLYKFGESIGKSREEIDAMIERFTGMFKSKQSVSQLMDMRIATEDRSGKTTATRQDLMEILTKANNALPNAARLNLDNLKLESLDDFRNTAKVLEDLAEAAKKTTQETSILGKISAATSEMLQRLKDSATPKSSTSKFANVSSYSDLNNMFSAALEKLGIKKSAKVSNVSEAEALQSAIDAFSSAKSKEDNLTAPDSKASFLDREKAKEQRIAAEEKLSSLLATARPSLTKSFGMLKLNSDNKAFNDKATEDFNKTMQEGFNGTGIDFKPVELVGEQIRQIPDQLLADMETAQASIKAALEHKGDSVVGAELKETAKTYAMRVMKDLESFKELTLDFFGNVKQPRSAKAQEAATAYTVAFKDSMSTAVVGVLKGDKTIGQVMYDQAFMFTESILKTFGEGFIEGLFGSKEGFLASLIADQYDFGKYIGDKISKWFKSLFTDVSSPTVPPIKQILNEKEIVSQTAHTAAMEKHTAALIASTPKPTVPKAPEKPSDKTEEPTEPTPTPEQTTNPILDGLQKLGRWITDKLQAGWEILKQLGSWLMQSLSGIFGGSGSLSGLFGGSGSSGGLGGMFSGITGMFDGLGDSIGTAIGSAFGLDGFGGWLSGLFFANGGSVVGAGTGTSDSIPAWLSNGEFVVNAKATKKHRGILEAINNGVMPRFALGGAVDGSMMQASYAIVDTAVAQRDSNKPKGQNQSVFHINVTGDISRQTRNEIQAMIPQIATGVNSVNRENGGRR